MNNFRHGDVSLHQIETLPKNLKKIEHIRQRKIWKHIK